ncbi:DUF1178 family protein [Rubrivivax rivuli]|uniref:DUF1178 family protein n=1 Tax=Rubrivivax rivuli TaxID=1862385 RepID=A0A437RER0_9BURK|nr:DUF1178 family protein [Rubrivivax rivuli]RVU45250.1 DUF1178 family protein [Rubrivivax rivuli]
MKVLDLRCSHGHAFEGWFASEDDFLEQNGRSLIACPLCGDHAISRTPSAPRLNLSGAREVVPLPGSHAAAEPAALPAQARVEEVQAAWLRGVRQLIARTEDVGARFPEEARRIHYGEAPNRGIRGHATPEEREALQEEGIETVAIPVPRSLDGPLQ